MILKITKIFLIAIALAATILGSLAYYSYSLLRPVDATDSRKEVFEVKTGQSSREIAAGLKSNGLVKSVWPVLAAARFINQPLIAGVYELSPNMSAIEIYKIIAAGKTRLLKVTIPEGFRIEQTGQRLDDGGLANYADFVNKAKQSEGKLFPDTYFFPAEVSVETIIKTMAANYQTKTASIQMTMEDLIIASIVEREAINDDERPLIAGIYKNRLKLAMKLEADPTVQYGKDNNSLLKLSDYEQENFKFWQPITLAEYQSVESEYNTYKFVGLPPGPICNPGLASLKAAINYQHHDYLYFLQKDGRIYPAKTEAEHNANRVKVLGVKLNS